VKDDKATKVRATKEGPARKPTERAVAWELAMSGDEALALYRSMFRIRRFETTCNELYLTARIPGMSPHLYIGEEAVGASVSFFLRKDDYIVSNHRGHGHCLGKGAAMDRMLAEIMGKSTGYCKGRGGSMHIADVSLGNLGANGIVGAGIPIAVGAGLSITYRGTDQISVCYFGDAATNQGTFHEAANMAAAMKLPVLLVCENNQYGLSTHIKKTCPTDCVADKAHGYGIEHATVDGMDTEACFAAARDAVAFVRARRAPFMLEFVTYRFLGHGASDNRSYRTREEEEQWKKRSPVESFRARLTAAYGVAEAAVAAVEAEVERELADALTFAEQSPEPSPEDALENVFAPSAATGRAAEAADGNGKPVPAPSPKSRKMTYREAVRLALREEMKRDERVFVIGEDVGTFGGAMAVTKGLFDELGAKRLVDTPISESAIVGAALGAALTGLVPVAEIMFIDFTAVCTDQIVNQVAKVRYMLGGQVQVPLVIRTQGGAGKGYAAQHSQSLEAWFSHVPGLIVVMPSTPRDARGLLKSAIREPNPVLFIEHKVLYNTEGEVPEDEELIPLGKAEVKRAGNDVTITAHSMQVLKALEAAETLAREHGIEAEVIDLRTIAPLDEETIFASVRKTGKLVTVEEGYQNNGIGAEVIARVASKAFDALDAEPARVAFPNCPIPFAKSLESALLPDAKKIVAAVLKTVGSR
jgi:2-oxoisovalerate dehydrogenase E1 component